MSLLSHSRHFSSRPRRPAVSRRRAKRSQPAVPAEVLEDRTLLTGLVMDESVFNVGQFAENLEEQVPVDAFGPNGVVGYSYAIIDGDPDNPITDAGNDSFKGFARMPWEPGGFVLADPERPQEIASPSKLITGATVMYLLQEQNPGLSYDALQDALQDELDQPIVNYLPATWGPGNPAANVNNWTAFFNTITVGELLTHTSGLLGDTSTGGLVTGPAGASAYTYAGLQQIAEGGIVNVNSPTDPTWATDYWTNNFAWFRVMLPYMWDEINNAALDANASNGILLDTEALTSNEALRDDLVDAMMEDWGAPFLPGTDFLVITPDQVVASIYKYYVSTNLLEPAGVDNPQTQTTGLAPTLMYPLDPTIVAGTDVWPLAGAVGPTPFLTPGVDTGDRTLEVGSRGWNLSAEDLARAFWAVRNGATDGTPIFEDATLDLMDAQGLGWQHSTNNGFVGDFGQYWGHNGINFRPSAPTALTIPSPNVPNPPGTANDPRLGSMNNTVAIAFDNGVAASLLINSQIQSEDRNVGTPVVIGAAFNPTATPTGTGTNASLIAAYDNAWTELVYDGNDDADATADDDFIIRQNTTNAAWIDIVHVGVNTITRRIDTLSKITLNGLDGEDTFDVQFLPANIELLINGGADNDDIEFGAGDVDTNIKGIVTVNGGGGGDAGDSLTIDDTADAGNDRYFFEDNEFDKWFFTGELTFNGVENVRLDANPDDNDIYVDSMPLFGIDLTIATTGGENTVYAGDGDFDTNITGDLTVIGDLDAFPDTLVILDQNDTGDDDYTFDGPTDTADATFDKSGYNGVTSYTLLESIVLEANDFDNTIDIEGTSPGVDVTVNAHGGNDTVNVTPTSRDLDDIGGSITVDGGPGFFDEIVIFDDNSTGDDDYTVTSTAFDKTGFAGLSYENVRDLDLRSNDFDNTITVNSLAAGVVLTVRAGAGNDTGVIGGAASDLDSSVFGEVHWHGGDDHDRLQFNDGADNVGNDSYTFSVNRFTKTGLPTWDYLQTEEVILNASTFDTTINVNSLVPVDLTINALLGDDTINIGNGRADLVRGDVDVNGFGSDVLNINDQNSPGPRTYTFTGQTFDMSAVFFGSLTYSSVTDVVLNTGDSGDTINVDSSSLITDIELFGNGGNDTFNIGNGDLDLIGGSVDAHGGADLDVVNVFDQTDVGDDDYTLTNNSVSKSNFLLQYDGMEELYFNANLDQNTINVESVLATTPMWINAGDSSDTIHLAPTAQQLSFIHAAVHVNGQDGVDNVFLHDELSNPLDPVPFAVTDDMVVRPIPPFIIPRFELHYEELERLVLQLGAADDLVDVQSTAHGMHVVVESGAGEDTVLANVPTPAQLTFDGGADDDTVQLVGTAASEEVSVSTGSGVADVNLISFEDASIDLAGGTDVLVYPGVPGVDEQVEVHATTNAHEGTLSVLGMLDLVFQNTEIIDLLANPGDLDAAAFVGTAQDDRFEIHLEAAGTNADPVLQLFEPDGITPLLTLRDYRNFGRFQVRGEDGADEFNVYALPSGPGTGRNLSVDGGAPSGPGNPNDGDRLNVYHDFQPPPPPNVDHDKDNQNNSGTIDIEYELHRFFIEYSDIENAVVLSNNAAG
jgi:hypothetical protein